MGLSSLKEISSSPNWIARSDPWRLWSLSPREKVVVFWQRCQGCDQRPQTWFHQTELFRPEMYGNHDRLGLGQFGMIQRIDYGFRILFEWQADYCHQRKSNFGRTPCWFPLDIHPRQDEENTRQWEVLGQAFVDDKSCWTLNVLGNNLKSFSELSWSYAPFKSSEISASALLVCLTSCKSQVVRSPAETPVRNPYFSGRTWICAFAQNLNFGRNSCEC